LLTNLQPFLSLSAVSAKRRLACCPSNSGQDYHRRFIQIRHPSFRQSCRAIGGEWPGRCRRWLSTCRRFPIAQYVNHVIAREWIGRFLDGHARQRGIWVLLR